MPGGIPIVRNQNFFLVLVGSIEYIQHMKIGTLILVGVLAVGGAVQKAGGVVKDNPYQSIIDRNAFNLNPPPPPETNAPPAPPNKILLTGVMSIGETTKAMLEITEPGPGKLPHKPILAAGQKEHGVEVLDIDAEKGSVKVKNGGIEVVLTFEKDGKTNAPTALVNLPVVGGGATPLSTVPTRTMSPTTRSPLVTPGAGGSYAAPNTGGAAYNPGAGATANPVVTGTSTSVVDPGLRTIPARTLRFDQVRPQTAEESILKVATATEMTADLVRRGEHPPYPPTVLTPNPPTPGSAGGAGLPALPTPNTPNTRNRLK